MNRLQFRGIQPIHSVLSPLDHRHNPNLAKHPQMLRHRRLRHPQPQHHLPHRILLPIGQHANHLTPPRLRDRVEHIRSCCRSSHNAIIFRYRNMSIAIRHKNLVARHRSSFSGLSAPEEYLLLSLQKPCPTTPPPFHRRDPRLRFCCCGCSCLFSQPITNAGVPRPWRSRTATWVGKYPSAQPALAVVFLACHPRRGSVFAVAIDLFHPTQALPFRPELITAL